ncbi:PREDICTED: uncharacterized protein LOC105360407 [Ceratosolen solmsi marchali]|uniref:Uncharacterized protein LOC105360407 n=1 Tax=Ceratosolen solmsi marchali TaxID=326594 RepID=A0AAJ6VNH6_9HYME|nr:PREDICTED: uncharacterized protein LOC105360407 [Ceratosolen solmsi marchali]
MCFYVSMGRLKTSVRLHPRTTHQESSSCTTRGTGEEGRSPPEAVEDAATFAATWMYKLFDEGEILLGGCGNAIDTLWEGFESVAVKCEEQSEATVGPDIIEAHGIYEEEMVAQESQAQGYGELLQTASRESKELISLEELMPRPGSSSSQSYQQHHQLQRQQQNYYNLAPIQESPYSTLFFGELTAATGLYPTPARSGPEGIGAPAPSAGLVVPCKAPPSNTSSTSSNPSAPEPYQLQMEATGAMVPERTRSGSSSRHYVHQQQQQQQHLTNYVSTLSQTPSAKDPTKL